MPWIQTAVSGVLCQACRSQIYPEVLATVPPRSQLKRNFRDTQAYYRSKWIAECAECAYMLPVATFGLCPSGSTTMRDAFEPGAK